MTAELISWVVILAFLVIVSKFNLLTVFERIGLTSTMFLLLAVVCLPRLAMRPNALRHRVQQLMPNRIAAVVLLVILVAAVTVAVSYWMRPPAFIG